MHCLYEENYYEEELIKIQDDIDETSDELDKSDKLDKLDKSDKESTKINISEELIEIKSPKKDENTRDWYDKNKF